MISKHIMQIIQFFRTLFGVSYNYNFPTGSPGNSGELVLMAQTNVEIDFLIGRKYVRIIMI